MLGVAMSGKSVVWIKARSVSGWPRRGRLWRGLEHGSVWLAKVRFGPARILARPLYEMDANGKDGGEREVEIYHQLSIADNRICRRHTQ